MYGGVLLFCLIAAQGDTPVIRINEMVEEALRVNPEILAAQKAVEAARQRPTQVGSLPDPMFSVGYAAAGAPYPGAGIGKEPTANIGAMVSQQLPGPGKLKLRSTIAQHEADETYQAYVQTQLRVVAQLKTAYHELHHAWIALEVIERNRSLMEQIVRVTEARYAVGQAQQQDIFKAQTQISLLEARKTKALQDKERAEAEMNMVLARNPSTPVGRPPMQTAKEILVTLDQLNAAARDTSPLLRGAGKRIERTELALNLAQKEKTPDYTVSAGYFNMGTMPDMYQFRLDFNLPNVFTAKKRAATTEQYQMVSQMRRMYEATDQNILFRLKDDWLSSSTSWKLMQMYATTLIPQATLTLESSMTAYQTGKVDFTTLLMNLQAVLEYEMNYHEEMMNYHVSLVRLEEVTGLRLIEE